MSLASTRTVKLLISMHVVVSVQSLLVSLTFVETICVSVQAPVESVLFFFCDVVYNLPVTHIVNYQNSTM